MRPSLEMLEDRLAPGVQQLVVIDFHGARLGPAARAGQAAVLASYLTPLGYAVIQGDGAKWLARGRREPGLFVQEILVTGGFPPGTLGAAPVAPPGWNLETTAYVSDARPGLVGVAAAHEWGHLMGLGHPVTEDPGNVMNATLTPGTFRGGRRPVELVSPRGRAYRAWQDALVELALSRRQPWLTY